MKIIIPLVVGFGRHGGFRVLSQLANHWMRDGHEVSFLVFKNSDEPYFPTTAEIVWYDEKGNILDTTERIKQSKFFLGILEIRKGLTKALNKLEADIVLATQNFSADPVAKSKIKAKKYYYIQAYEPEFYEKGPLHYKVYHWIAKRSYKKNLIPIVNSKMYFNYREIRSDKLVYPGLDFKLFHPKENKARNEVFRFGTIGRKEEIKGTAYVIEAFRKARAELGDKIELVIAFGDEAGGAIEGVRMEFPKNDAELAAYYQNLDCYLCGGTWQLDAVHYPVIESMACKVPVITTGYYPANNQNAYIVPVKNADAMGEAIIEVFNSEKMANEKAEIAFQQIQEFSWDNVSEKMLSIFNSSN
ncbi:glycosyltransferase family 4 protein [Kaistella sp.]|uniref:glycosyltransferase family 4 protein n=1 Tax=Kaistella sp. TaxID=2782235 RepID=UPI002F959920